MRMSRAELMCRAVWSAKRDRDIELPARHREHIRRVVHDLIECDQRKTERHEFDDRPQPDHGRADAQAGKSVLADWSVDDAFRPEALKQALAHLVSAVVFRDFFAHQKNVRIALQFFRERFIECLAISDFSHRPSSAVAARVVCRFIGSCRRLRPPLQLRRHMYNRKVFRAAARDFSRRILRPPAPSPSPVCRSDRIVRSSICLRA